MRARTWVAIVLYLVGGTALLGLLLGMRGPLLERMSTAAEQQNWEAWREEAAKQDGKTGPVQRRVPKSKQPPMLVLLRDHFAVIISAAVVFYTVLFGFGAYVVGGVLDQRGKRG